MHRIDKCARSHQGPLQRIQVAALQDLLSDNEIELICRRVGHTWRNRVFTPAVTRVPACIMAVFRALERLGVHRKKSRSGRPSKTDRTSR